MMRFLLMVLFAAVFLSCGEDRTNPVQGPAGKASGGGLFDLFKAGGSAIVGVGVDSTETETPADTTATAPSDTTEAAVVDTLEAMAAVTDTTEQAVYQPSGPGLSFTNLPGAIPEIRVSWAASAGETYQLVRYVNSVVTSRSTYTTASYSDGRANYTRPRATGNSYNTSYVAVRQVFSDGTFSQWSISSSWRSPTYDL